MVHNYRSCLHGMVACKTKAENHLYLKFLYSTSATGVFNRGQNSLGFNCVYQGVIRICIQESYSKPKLERGGGGCGGGGGGGGRRDTRGKSFRFSIQSIHSLSFPLFSSLPISPFPASPRLLVETAGCCHDAGMLGCWDAGMLGYRDVFNARLFWSVARGRAGAPVESIPKLRTHPKPDLTKPS